MLERILQLLSLSCRHRRTTQPFPTAAFVRSSPDAEWEAVTPSGGHYVVCLDCGRKFPYDWKEMRIVFNAPAAQHHRS